MTGPIITVALATIFASGANASIVDPKLKAKAGSAIQHGEIFKKLDANSDGKISLDEFKKLHDVMPKAKKEKSAGSQKVDLEKVFKHLDKNSDGFISKAEFEEFGKKAKEAVAKKKAKNP